MVLRFDRNRPRATAKPLPTLREPLAQRLVEKIARLQDRERDLYCLELLIDRMLTHEYEDGG